MAEESSPQQDLDEARARLAALERLMPRAMAYQVVVGDDGHGRRFVYISDRCEAVLGVPQADALADPARLAQAIKALPVHLSAPRPLGFTSRTSSAGVFGFFAMLMISFSRPVIET